MSEIKSDQSRLQQIQNDINTLVNQLSQLKDIIARRQAFARLKLFLLLDFWDIQFLGTLSQHFTDLDKTLKACAEYIEEQINNAPTEQAYLDLIRNAESLATQLDALTKLGLAKIPRELLPALRLASIDPDEPSDVMRLANIWLTTQTRDSAVWESVKEFLRVTGLRAEFIPAGKLNVERFNERWPAVLTDQRDKLTIFLVTLKRDSSNGPSRGSVPKQWSYIIVAGNEQQTSILRNLLEALGQTWPDECRSLASELQPLVLEALNTNFRDPSAERLLTALDKIYHACQDHGTRHPELRNLFKWWHKFIKTFFCLEILPQVKDYPKLELYLSEDEIRSLPEDKVHAKPVSNPPQPAGTVLQLDRFWCDKITFSKPITWTVSTGKCPRNILKVAELPVDKSWMCDELIQWVTTAKQLRFIETHRERRFDEACLRLRDTIKQAKHDSKISDNLNELFRCASRNTQALRMPPDKAQAWLDLLRECAQIDLDPRIETGEEARCNTDLWKNTQSRELPPAVEVTFNDLPAGYIISSEVASVDPQYSRYTVSLGPQEKAPESLQRSWALYDKSKQTQTTSPGDLAALCGKLFRRECYAFLTGDNENPLTDQDVKNILNHLINLRRNNSSLATDLFSLFRDYGRTRGWTIQPEDYDLTAFFADLSENARKGIEKYEFDEAYPEGYITPLIDSIDNTNRIVTLKFRVSVGKPPEDFAAIREIVNTTPALGFLQDLVRDAPERFKQIQSSEHQDPRDIWIDWFVELYQKFTEEFPEDGPQPTKSHLDENLLKKLDSLREHLNKLAKSLELTFWEPGTMSEADERRTWVMIENENDIPIGANNFYVRRRAVKHGEKTLLACKIWKYRRD